MGRGLPSLSDTRRHPLKHPGKGQPAERLVQVIFEVVYFLAYGQCFLWALTPISDSPVGGGDDPPRQLGLAAPVVTGWLG